MNKKTAKNVNHLNKISRAYAMLMGSLFHFIPHQPEERKKCATDSECGNR
jgi:hypothetical protein